jgi:hypothetical protein
MSISSIISSVVGVSAGLYYTCKIVFPKLFTVVDAESTTATSTVAVSTIFGPSLFLWKDCARAAAIVLATKAAAGGCGHRQFCGDAGRIRLGH